MVGRVDLLQLHLLKACRCELKRNVCSRFAVKESVANGCLVSKSQNGVVNSRSKKYKSIPLVWGGSISKRRIANKSKSSQLGNTQDAILAPGKGAKTSGIS